MIYIYTITDPRDNSIFYVGQTKDPKSRFYQHLNSSGSPAKQLIDSIIKEKLKPIFTLIEECEYRYSFERESYWILKLHKEGCNLVNKKVKKLPYEINILENVSFDSEKLI